MGVDMNERALGKTKRNRATQPLIISILAVVYSTTQFVGLALGFVIVAIDTSVPEDIFHTSVSQILVGIASCLYIGMIITFIPTALFSLLITWIILRLQRRKARFLYLCSFTFGTTFTIFILYGYLTDFPLDTTKVITWILLGASFVSGIIGSSIGARFTWGRLIPTS